LVTGTPSAPKRIDLEQVRQKLAGSAEPASALLAFFKWARTFIAQHNVTDVAIIQGQGGKFAASPERVKLETAVSLAGADLDRRVHLVSKTRLRAREKKFESETGHSVEVVLNGGEAFKPKDLREAILVAWTVLS